MLLALGLEFETLTNNLEWANGKKIWQEDLVKYPPDYFIAVPLVFDTLYK